jgi:formylglycine-generating enzyme required for sulfatase activity
MPYPNGYVREPQACVNDRPWKQFHGEALMPRSGRAAMIELDRLWQGVASGTRPACKSSFGVYDMTGNVDEWTRSSIPGERPSVLKGGYWGPVRTRCRPATKAHGEEHTFYQQGFRCCADPSR